MSKMDYVVIGSNKNPLYLDFWPVVSKVWKTKFGVTPVLGLIDDFESEIEESEYGLIKRFKSSDNILPELQSQIVRLYLPKYLNGYCLISDIDMFPLSKKYFEECASNLTNDNMVIYSSNHPQTIDSNMFPMCYVSAHSDVYKDIFDINLDWDDFCKLLVGRGEYWYTDQKYLYEKAMDFHNKTNKLILLNRVWNAPIDNRVDRSSWSYSPELVKEEYYIDCHSLRPYNEHKEEIDKLIELL